MLSQRSQVSRIMAQSAESDLRSALKCVEDLLEPNISEEQFCKAAELVTVSQYCDVVDERNIEMLCGYPPCGNKLVGVTKQKYHISTTRNQVLDLTQRKKFCSPRCFKASNYYSSQLSTLPPNVRTGSRSVKLLASHKEDTTHLCQNVFEAHTATEGTDGMLKGEVHTGGKDGMLKGEVQTGGKDAMLKGEVQTGGTDGMLKGEVHTGGKDAMLKGEVHTGGKDGMLKGEVQTGVEWTTANKGCHVYPHVVESSVQKLAEALETWMSGPDQSTSDCLSIPPLHDVCPSLVQRSLFMSQLRRNAASMCNSLGVQEAMDDIVSFASSFKLSNTCVTFRPSEWHVIVLLLLALCQIEVSDEVLDKSLQSIKASRDDFHSLLERANQLHSTFATPDNMPLLCTSSHQ